MSNEELNSTPSEKPNETSPGVDFGKVDQTSMSDNFFKNVGEYFELPFDVLNEKGEPFFVSSVETEKNTEQKKEVTESPAVVEEKRSTPVKEFTWDDVSHFRSESEKPKNDPYDRLLKEFEDLKKSVSSKEPEVKPTKESPKEDDVAVFAKWVSDQVTSGKNPQEIVEQIDANLRSIEEKQKYLKELEELKQWKSRTENREKYIYRAQDNMYRLLNENKHWGSEETFVKAVGDPVDGAGKFLHEVFTMVRPNMKTASTADYSREFSDWFFEVKATSPSFLQGLSDVAFAKHMARNKAAYDAAKKKEHFEEFVREQKKVSSKGSGIGGGYVQ